MRNVIIYMNCIGEQINKMFRNVENYRFIHIVNYIEMKSDTLPIKYSELLKSADYFIYQPFNKHHKSNPWYPTNLLSYLNHSCIKIKVNYYRFRGFWNNPTYKSNLLDDKFNNISDIINNFNSALKKLMLIDNNSDIKMYDFFISNYKTTKMFHDCFHPTNYFITEMCNQIAKKINIDIKYISECDELDINKKEISDDIKITLNLDIY